MQQQPKACRRQAEKTGGISAVASRSVGISSYPQKAASQARKFYFDGFI